MSDRLNTQDLVDLLVKCQGNERKDVENFVKEFFALIEEALEKDKVVKIKGLGTFKLVGVESRESINVNTGERFEIKGHTKISYVPDANLRDVINKPFAHFKTVVLNKDVIFDDENKEEEVINEEKKDVLQQTDTKISSKEDEEEAFLEVSGQKEVQPENIDSIPKQKEKKDVSNNILIYVIIATITLCAGVLFFAYYSDIFPSVKQQNEMLISNEGEVLNYKKDEKPIIDSTTLLKPDEINDELSLKTEIETTIQSAAIEKEKLNKPSVQDIIIPDSTSYTIVGTKTAYTIQRGETLTRVALKFYGTKNLWPYLVIHNRSKIANPDLVPYGTTINIPELKKK